MSGYGWVEFGETESSDDLPQDQTDLLVVVSLIQSSDGKGFYWGVTPGREVIKSLAEANSSDRIAFALHCPSLTGHVQATWRNPNPITWDGDDFTVRDLGPGIFEVDLSGVPDDVYEFSLWITYQHGGQSYDCELDPELDIGMEGGPG